MDGIDKLTRHEYNGVMTTVRVYKCKRCGHEWPSKLQPPRICSKCKSPYYDTPRRREGPARFNHHCQHCQHKWASKLDRPKVCPSCRTPYWETPRTRPPRAKAKPEPAPALDDSFNPIVKVARELQDG